MLGHDMLGQHPSMDARGRFNRELVAGVNRVPGDTARETFRYEQLGH